MNHSFIRTLAAGVALSLLIPAYAASTFAVGQAKKAFTVAVLKAKVGDTVTYTIAYTFAGDSPTRAHLFDALPEGVTYVAGSVTSTEEMTFTGFETDEEEQEAWLEWDADSLTTSGTVTYKVTIDSDAASVIHVA